MAFVLQAPRFREPQSIVAHYLLIHPFDVNQYLGGPISQAWSLSTIVSFYVVLPLFALIMGRSRRVPTTQVRIEVVVVGVLWAGSVSSTSAWQRQA